MLGKVNLASSLLVNADTFKDIILVSCLGNSFDSDCLFARFTFVYGDLSPSLESELRNLHVELLH